MPISTLGAANLTSLLIDNIGQNFLQCEIKNVNATSKDGFAICVSLHSFSKEDSALFVCIFNPTLDFVNEIHRTKLIEDIGSSFHTR